MADTGWGLAPLPWQRDAWGRLRTLLESGRLPHAMLCSGPAGIGKAQLLQALAAELLCEAPAAGTACGQCRSCGLLQAGTHADLLQVGPEEDSRVIKIDQVRALIEFAVKTPALGARKVILLGPAEVMNISAANALLKVLEEPSASTTLLLFSHQPSLLPATVRSRCQLLPLATPAPEDSRPWLDQVTGEPGLSDQLLRCTEQRPLLARALYFSDSLEQRLAVQRALEALLKGELSPLAFPLLVKEWELGEVLEMLQTNLQNSLRERALAGETGAGQRRAFELLEGLGRLRRSISRGANPNRQLTLEDCVTQLALAVGAAGS